MKVTATRIHQSHEQEDVFLAILGSHQGGRVFAGCRLPSTTRLDDEDLEASLNKLLRI